MKYSFGDTDNYTYSSPLSSSIRPAFVKKVYGILSIQLLFTFLMCYASMTYTKFKLFQLENTGILSFFTLLTIILPIVIMCNKSLARQVPTNYLILGAFTFGESYIVSTVCGIYDPNTVSMAAFLTLGITFGLTLYAMTTKKDITYFGGLMFMVAVGLLFGGIANFFMRSNGVEIVLALGGAILYGIYIIYDTQLIIGGKRGELQVDDYIFAALMLYIDIIVLFLKILKLLDKLADKKNKK